MAVLELITRFRNLAGAGFAELSSDMKGLEQSALSADIRTAALQQQSRMLGQEMNRLAKEVATGKLSVDDAETAYQKFERSLTKVDAAAAQARTGFGKMQDTLGAAQQSWMAVATPIESTIAILERVGQSAKQAYQFVSEGAEMALVANRFDNLTRSIGTTTDALMGDLRTASKGMVADAELMASATDFINLGFAKSHDEAVRLSAVSSQLGWNMQQLSLTLANQSTMRLDALGLSIESVTGRAKELESQGYRTDEAFKMSLIEAGEAKLELLGSAAETAAGKMAILEANAKNFGASFKQSFSEEFLANLNSFAGGMFEAEDSSSKFGETLGKIVTNVSILGFLRFAKEELKGMSDEAKRASTETSESFAGMGGRSQKSMHVIASSTGEAKKAAQEHAAAVKAEHVAMVASMTAIDDRREAIVQHSMALAADISALSRQAALMYQESSPAYAELQDKMAQSNAILSDEEAAFRQSQAAAAAANEELYRRVEAENAAAEATAKHEAAMAAYNGKMREFMVGAVRGGNELELFTHNLDELGQQTVVVSNLTADQQAEMDRLQAAYDKAGQTIRDYELGIKGATLTDEKRNEKIAEQQAIMATLATSMQPLIDAGSSVATANNALVISTSAANSSLFEMVAASDASAFSIAAAGIALGVFDETAAEAYLKTAILKIKMDELAASFAETGNVNALVEGMRGAITEVNEMSLSLNGATGSVHMYDESANRATQSTESMIQKFGEVPDVIETEVQLESQAAMDSFIRYKGIIDEIPSTVTTNVVTNYSSTGSASPGTANASGGHQQMSTGGRVSGGIPGKDSVPALLKPNERVLTESENIMYERLIMGRSSSQGLGQMNRSLISEIGSYTDDPIGQRMRGVGSDLDSLVGASGGRSSYVGGTAAAAGGGAGMAMGMAPLTVQIINQFSSPISQSMLGQIEASQKQAIDQALAEQARRASAMNRMRG